LFVNVATTFEFQRDDRWRSILFKEGNCPAIRRQPGNPVD
jgi:hypothetical protein